MLFMKENKIGIYIYLGVMVLLITGCALSEVYRSNILQPVEVSGASKIIICEAVPQWNSFDTYKFIDDIEISGTQITGPSKKTYKAYTSHGIVPKMLKNGEMADSYFIFIDVDKMLGHAYIGKQTLIDMKQKIGNKYLNPVELKDIIGESEANKIKSEILKEQKKQNSGDDLSAFLKFGFESTSLPENEYKFRKDKVFFYKNYSPTLENNEILLKQTEIEKSMTTWIVRVPEKLMEDAGNNYHFFNSCLTYRKGHMDPNIRAISTIFFFKNACYAHAYDTFQFDSRGKLIGHKFLSGQDTECLTKQQLKNVDVVYNTAKYDFIDWLKTNIKMKNY
jgi:hypothetical protein